MDAAKVYREILEKKSLFCGSIKSLKDAYAATMHAINKAHGVRNTGTCVLCQQSRSQERVLPVCPDHARLWFSRYRNLKRSACSYRLSKAQPLDRATLERLCTAELNFDEFLHYTEWKICKEFREMMYVVFNICADTNHNDLETV